MRALIEAYFEFVKLGASLCEDLPVEIQEASARGWDSDLIRNIQRDVTDYFRAVSKIAKCLALLAFLPLPFCIFFLLLHKYYASFNLICGLWVGVIGLCSVLLIWPVIGVTRILRELPAPAYKPILRTAWMNIDLLNILVNAGLFLYFFASVKLTSAFPIILLLVVLWLFVPWVAYAAGRDLLFIKVRIVQLASIILLALLISISPIPMQHLQSWAERATANKLRPSEQKEVTANWSSLKWFTQEGQPNVWFAENDAHGYHLFIAPGFDEQTNQELKPVLDMATKDIIVEFFAKQMRQDEEKKMIHDYVLDATSNQGEATHRVAFIVLKSGNPADAALIKRISQTLAAAGVANDSAVFTPAFVKSSSFRDILAGQVSPDAKFHVENYAEFLLVVQVAISMSAQEPVSGTKMLTADNSMKIIMYNSSSGHIEHEAEVSARGIGFNEADALEDSYRKAEKELSVAINAFKP